MKLSAVAQHLGCSLPENGGDEEIERVASLEAADATSITFVSADRFRGGAGVSQAAAILVRRGQCIEGKVCLEVDDPYVAYARAAQLFEDKEPVFGAGVHQTAVIDPASTLHPSVAVGPSSVVGPGCEIGEGTVVDARCVVERGTRIGRDCRIHSGAVIRRDVTIGNRVIIQSGAVIGSEGFGNAREGAQFVRIPCFGRVIIEDDAEIGANTTVDRGNFEPTVIRRGARIDNLVHLAHNVIVGEDSALAAQVGISGSTKVGNRVLIGGQAGFVGHIEIGDDSFVGAKAGVSKNVEPGAKVTGYPARDLMKMRRIEAAQTSLPEMAKELKRLRRLCDEAGGTATKGE